RTPETGYYISTTPVVTGIGTSKYDARRYVDASKIPYGAWAGWWKHFGVNLGDFGLVIDAVRRRSTGFVFADSGTAKVGEVSSKVFGLLARGEHPHVVNEGFFLFLVFPGSGMGVRPDQKYVLETVVQQSVNDWIKNNMDRVDDIASLIQFLALDADNSKF